MLKSTKKITKTALKEARENGSKFRAATVQLLEGLDKSEKKAEKKAKKKAEKKAKKA